MVGLEVLLLVEAVVLEDIREMVVLVVKITVVVVMELVVEQEVVDLTPLEQVIMVEELEY